MIGEEAEGARFNLQGRDSPILPQPKLGGGNEWEAIERL